MGLGLVEGIMVISMVFITAVVIDTVVLYFSPGIWTHSGCLEIFWKHMQESPVCHLAAVGKGEPPPFFILFSNLPSPQYPVPAFWVARFFSSVMGRTKRPSPTSLSKSMAGRLAFLYPFKNLGLDFSTQMKL